MLAFQDSLFFHDGPRTRELEDLVKRTPHKSGVLYQVIESVYCLMGQQAGSAIGVLRMRGFRGEVTGWLQGSGASGSRLNPDLSQLGRPQRRLADCTLLLRAGLYLRFA